MRHTGRIEKLEEQIDIAYDEYLKTDHWSYLSGEVKRRADGRCQVCYGGGMVDAHHRTYIRYPNRERIEDITCMCRDCHTWFTITHEYNYATHEFVWREEIGLVHLSLESGEIVLFNPRIRE